MAGLFDQLIEIRVDTNIVGLLSPAQGQNYVYIPRVGSWVSNHPITPARPDGLVTWASVAGRFFVMYESDRLLEYDTSSGGFIDVTPLLPAGVAMTAVRGCAGIGNYLVLFTSSSYIYSSLIDVLDFQSTDQGAGRITPIELKGSLVVVFPTAGGAILASTENVLLARFTNNAQAPFAFQEIRGSAGLISPEQITANSNQGIHYMWGSGGLQALTADGAQNIFGDATDYISSRLWDVFAEVDPFHTSITSEVSSGPHRVKLQFLSNRYLMISLGRHDTTTYNIVLVYDTLHQRWGKLYVEHQDIGILPLDTGGVLYTDLLATGITYTQVLLDGTTYIDWLPTPVSDEPRANYIFLKDTGQCDRLVVGGDQGALFVGRVQLTRDKGVTFQTALLEGAVPLTAQFKLSGSHSGADREVSYLPTLLQSGDNYAMYEGRFSCTNFEAAVLGTFDLTQVTIETTLFPIRPNSTEGLPG